ncbi:MAG: acyl carrier protein [Rhodothermales bacterium]|jgi:acyl carrier protein
MTSIRDVLASVWQVEPDSIPADARLNAYPAWDSLGHITLLLALSEKFGFTLTPDNVQDMISLPAIESFIQSLEIT